ncbi:MAG TPA: hypothetical protein VEG27_03440 [Usitatibacter sp.]|nr:hypothetical protein [Usitatibacter sp.]
MGRRAWLAAALVAAAGAWPCLADEGDGSRTEAKAAYREGYQRGYDEGFDRGYRKGLEEGRASAIAEPPHATGPITVSSANYGTSSRRCDATRFVARRANGKRTYSFEVSNDMCGDPSHGDRKALEVAYVCGSIAKTASANEHRTIQLDCTP